MPAALTPSFTRQLRDTVFLRAFGLFKIPVLFFIRPTVLEATVDRCEIKVPLRKRTSNHLGSMYFGVLACGADCAGGLIAMRLIRESGKPVSLVFKDFHAEFLKRAESDVHFVCEDGSAIRQLVEKASQSDERQNLPVTVVATCPKTLGKEPVAKFTLTLSLKRSPAA